MYGIKNLRRHALIGAAAALLPAAALLGLGSAGLASAQVAPTYVPLFNIATGIAQGGDLTVTPGASSSSVTIYLQNVVPNMTYAVSNCTISAVTAVESCAAGSPATMTTDATGNGTASFTFPTSAVGTIAITDAAIPGDAYYAAVNGAPVLPLLNTLGGLFPLTMPVAPTGPSAD